MRAGRLLALGALCSLALASDASAGGRWGAPEPVSFGRAGHGTLAVAPNGRAVVLSGAPRGLRAAVRKPGGRFGRPLLIPGSVSCCNPVVGIGRSGSAIAAWRDSKRDAIRRAALDPGARQFGPAGTLAGFDESARPIAALVAAGGKGLLLVSSFSFGNEEPPFDSSVYAASRLVGGDFGAPVAVLGPGRRPTWLETRGAVVFLTSQVEMQEEEAVMTGGHVAVRLPHGALTPPAKVPFGPLSCPLSREALLPGRCLIDFDVAVNRGGDVLVAWCVQGPRRRTLFRAAYRPAGRPFGQVQRIARARERVCRVKTALADDREGLVGYSSGPVLRVVARTPGRGIRRIGRLHHGVGLFGLELSFEANAAGDAIALWSAAGRVRASTRRRDGTFGAPVTLARAASLRNFSPNVGLDAAGNATVVYRDAPSGLRPGLPGRLFALNYRAARVGSWPP